MDGCLAVQGKGRIYCIDTSGKSGFQVLVQQITVMNKHPSVCLLNGPLLTVRGCNCHAPADMAMSSPVR